MAKFNIEDVVDYLGIHKLKAGNGCSIPIQCPYCGDRRGKNTIRLFKDGRDANVFSCYNCGKSGNMLDLYLDFGKCYVGADRYKQAYADLKEMLVERQPKRDYSGMQKKAPKESQKAAPEILDRTYRTMLSFLRIQQDDKEDLLERGLTEKQIADGFFRTTPKDRTGICRKLLKAGCILDGVPGFFRNTTNAWELNVYSKASGYFCPVIQDGLMIGMQIRIRKPQKGEPKYVWLTSSNKEHGTSSGVPASFHGTPDSDVVLVIEGILKSYITHCFAPNFSIIGVPGVSCLKDVEPILKRHNHKFVYEVYDMDKRQNPYCLAYKETCSYCMEKCNDCMQQGNYKRDGACRRKVEQFMEENPQQMLSGICLKNCCGYYNQDGTCQKIISKTVKIAEAVNSLENIVQRLNLGMGHYNWDFDRNTGYWLGNAKGTDDYLLQVRKGVYYGNPGREAIRYNGYA